MSSAVGKVSREEWRRQKDLEAARKAGTAPAEMDDDGNAINPHIPEYITKAPWYLDNGRPSLNHQKRPKAATDNETKFGDWYDRGQTAGPAATKYRKGACSNCGALTHSQKDCLERPRKKGAKFTGKDIVADEVILSGPRAGYDAKRDRWNGYDPENHKTVMAEYEAMEEERKRLREEEVDQQHSKEASSGASAAKKEKKPRGTGLDDDEEFGSSDEDEKDEDQYAEAADAVGQKLDTKTRVTVRNLRIREDTAKYLMNLDVESAYYDPKTRSMREAPNQGNPEDMAYAGDNFHRYSGDATNIQKLQLFAWNASSRGNDVHVQANPTQAQVIHKEFLEKKDKLKDTSKVSILARYGGEEHLERLPTELLTGQTEDYVEYSRTGAVIKGQERAKPKTKYTEDVYLQNHTSVWGSWYDLSSGTWGFACCHSIIPGSYCTGSAGIEASSASSVANLLAAATSRSAEDREAEQTATKSLAEQHLDKLATNGNGKGKGRATDEDPSQNFSKTRIGEGDVEFDKDKLKKAIEAEKKRKALDEDEAWSGTKKAKTDVTEEELEAYRLTRASDYDDPMANYKDTEGV